MGRNVDAVIAEDLFFMPASFTPEEIEFFESRAEWRLERLRRTDFDLTGEHARYAVAVLDIA